jgi:hypothetical protein
MQLVFFIIKFLPTSNEKKIHGLVKRIFIFDFTEICFLRLLASMVMVAIGRHWDGIDNMMAARFSVYSVSMVIISYLLVLKLISQDLRRFFQISAIIISAFFCVFGYLKYDSDANYHVSKLKADSYNYANHHVYFYQYLNLPDPAPDFYRNYKYPHLLKEDITEHWVTENRMTVNESYLTVSATAVSNTGQYGTFITPVIEFDVQVRGLKLPGKEIYVSICPANSPASLYLIALRERNGSWIGRLSQNQSARFFFGTIPRKIAPGIYTVKLCWVENGKPAARLVSNNILIE